MAAKAELPSRTSRIVSWLAGHSMVAVWFLIIGALILGVEIVIHYEPGQNAASAVILLFGGYEVILDQINKRIMNREIAESRRQAEESNRKYEASERENAELRRKSEAAEQENAELRRRIAELEQGRNGAQ